MWRRGQGTRRGEVFSKLLEGEEEEEEEKRKIGKASGVWWGGEA
jgi:hypothetical protein